MFKTDEVRSVWFPNWLRPTGKGYLVLRGLQVKMTLTRSEEVTCLKAAIEFTVNGTQDASHRQFHNQQMQYYEFIVEWAEAIGSEWVVAKYFGLDFDPFEPKFKHKADVGNAIEVKWTKYVAGQLIVHEYDRPNDIAVLVTGQAPHYFIAGWIPIAMAQRPKYRHSKQPNWWVTQINLQPIENLRKSNYGHSAI